MAKKVCGPMEGVGIVCRDWSPGDPIPGDWTVMEDWQCGGGVRAMVAPSLEGDVVSDAPVMAARTPHTTRFVSVSSLAVNVSDEGEIDPLALVPIPDNINEGLTSAKNSTMLQILGMPRDHVDDKCRMPTNRPLVDLIVTKDVGPFRVTGIKPAVKSLKRIFGEIQNDLPEVYSLLGTAGMTCVRLIKNSRKLSNHSWGCAIDLKIGAVLDGVQYPRAGEDGVTLAGLAAISPYFHKEGWYWGVGFSSFEDGMHFEVADETIRAWQEEGALGEDAAGRAVTESNLSIGDRGKEVKELQRALARKGYDILDDGDFGPITHGIVIDFQASNGLVADGIVGPETRQALGI